MLEIIRKAVKPAQGATTDHARNSGSPGTSQRWCGKKASPAPAGAGTPVRKPADLCGCTSASILALNRASRSAQDSACASAKIQPNFGMAWSEDRKSVVEGQSVSVRVDLGGRRIIKKQKNKTKSR